VGWFEDATGRAHGYRRFDGRFTTIDVPGAIFTLASGINARGQIVGEQELPGAIRGFLLDEETFTTIDVPNSVATLAARL
jgi:hypothetical protein